MARFNAKNILKLAKDQSKVWEGSHYYADAERWNHVIWRESTDFFKFFRKLDLKFTLELACGHGRHSKHIIEHFYDEVTHLIMMDILQSNMEFCKNRIHSNKVTFIQNDGIHLNDVGDNYCTSIFCYDAMVHFDREVVLAYLHETYRVLRFGGMGLFHHSNYSENAKNHFSQNPHARAFMSATLFSDFSKQAGLKIVEQKIIPWGDSPELDCLTLVSK
ncbi:MAG: class I SAM-dependent methyltransferase [Chloroflexota bacterium]